MISLLITHASDSEAVEAAEVAEEDAVDSAAEAVEAVQVAVAVAVDAAAEVELPSSARVLPAVTMAEALPPTRASPSTLPASCVAGATTP